MRWLVFVGLLIGCKERPKPETAPSVSGEAIGDDLRIPGVQVAGRTALLSGAFAPVLIPDRSDRTYAVTTSTGVPATVGLSGAFSVALGPPLSVRGKANLVVPVSDTQLTVFDGGRPVQSMLINVGGKPGLQKLPGRRIEMKSEKFGAVAVESDCTLRLIRPVPRGSTSCVVIRLGPPRQDFDPLYTAEEMVDEASPCTGTATIVLAP